MTGIFRDRRGTVAVEFALLAPALFALVFIVIEGSRYMWTKQVVQETAAASARCMSIEWGRTASTTIKCVNNAGVRAWGVARAANSKVTVAITDADIVLTTTASNGCTNDPGLIGMRMVTVRSNFRSVVTDLIPSLPTAISSRACFPAIA